jgi:hypothetical protein
MFLRLNLISQEFYCDTFSPSDLQTVQTLTSSVRDRRTVLPFLTGLCFPSVAIPSAEAPGYFHGIPFRLALCRATG